MRSRVLAALTAAAVVIAGSLLVAAPASAAVSCGQVLVSGSQWLGGAGVPVKANGADQSSGLYSCANLSTGNPSVQYGYGFQCVELAARLYKLKGWGTVYAAGNGGARYIPEGSPSLSWHVNGTGYIPVPGDLVIYDGTASGHVSVVDTVNVATGTVNVVQQNAGTPSAPIGRATLHLSGSTLSGGPQHVRGVEHSPKNTATSTTGSGLTKTAFQANTGNLYASTPTAATNLGQGMRGGTSPAITTLPSGGYEMAFQANTGNLYGFGDAGNINTQQGMMAGTSPAIAASQGGGYKIAFQANTGNLYQYVSGGQASNLSLGMKAGTSPSIAALSTGGYEIAFQANTGNLWLTGDAGTFDTGQGMMSGTSPAIAATNGGFKVAFQANTGNLYQYVSSGQAANLNLGMKGGTSPVITILSSGGYQIAFQANTGNLWSTGDAGTTDTQQGMMAGTSPSITHSGSSWSAAFQANTGNLYRYDYGSGESNTQQGMMAGTSPAIG